MAESPRFRDRDQVRGFIRWLAANLHSIDARWGSAPLKTDGELEFEARFGPPEWQPPESAAEAVWIKERHGTAASAVLYLGPEPMIRAVWLRPVSRLEGFLDWLRDDIASIDIDPPDLVYR